MKACQDERSDPNLKYSCGAANTETFLIYTNGNNKLEYTGGLNGRLVSTINNVDIPMYGWPVLYNKDPSNHCVIISMTIIHCTNDLSYQ